MLRFCRAPAVSHGPVRDDFEGVFLARAPERLQDWRSIGAVLVFARESAPGRKPSVQAQNPCAPVWRRVVHAVRNSRVDSGTRLRLDGPDLGWNGAQSNKERP